MVLIAIKKQQSVVSREAFNYRALLHLEGQSDSFIMFHLQCKHATNRCPFHRLFTMLIFIFFTIACLLFLPIMLSQIHFLSIMCLTTFNFSSFVLLYVVVFLSFFCYYSSFICFVQSTTYFCILMFYYDFKDTTIHYQCYLHFLLTPLLFTRNSLCNTLSFNYQHVLMWKTLLQHLLCWCYYHIFLLCLGFKISPARKITILLRFSRNFCMNEALCAVTIFI